MSGYDGATEGEVGKPVPSGVDSSVASPEEELVPAYVTDDLTAEGVADPEPKGVEGAGHVPGRTPKGAGKAAYWTDDLPAVYVAAWSSYDVADHWTVEADAGRGYADSSMEVVGVPGKPVAVYLAEEGEAPSGRVAVTGGGGVGSGWDVVASSLPPSRESVHAGAVVMDESSGKGKEVTEEAGGAAEVAILTEVELVHAPSDGVDAAPAPSGGAGAAYVEAVPVAEESRYLEADVDRPRAVDTQAVARSRREVRHDGLVAVLSREAVPNEPSHKALVRPARGDRGPPRYGSHSKKRKPYTLTTYPKGPSP